MRNAKKPAFNADAAEEYFSDLLFYCKTFCPKCGSPFTDEAVKIKLKELEALNDGETCRRQQTD